MYTYSILVLYIKDGPPFTIVYLRKRLKVQIDFCEPKPCGLLGLNAYILKWIYFI